MSAARAKATWPSARPSSPNVARSLLSSALQISAISSGRNPVDPPDARLGDVVPQVARQHAPGGEVPRVEGHDHARHLQLAGERGRVHRAGSSEGDDHEVARVAAPAHRDELEEMDHVRVRDPDHAERRVVDAHVERVCDGRERRSRPVDVERDLAAEEVVRVDASGDHVRVGHRRLRAAPPVAGRPGLGAGAARSDLERAGRVDPGDRAAAGADLDDVDDRHLDRVARRTPACARSRSRPPAARSSPSTSEAFAVVPPMSSVIRFGSPISLPDRGRPDHAADRPRLDELDRRLRGDVEAGDAAVRLHAVVGLATRRPPPRAARRAPPGSRPRSASRRRRAPRCEARSYSRHSLVSSCEAVTGASGHSSLTISAARRSCAGFAYEWRKRDRDRLGAEPARVGDRAPHVVLVEGRQHLALVGDALGHLEAQAPPDERLRLAVEQVVEVGPVRLLDLEHVAEARAS